MSKVLSTICILSVFVYLVQAGDWPNLAHYNASNAILSALPAGSNQVVFMGDSIIQYWHLDVYFPGRPYVNRGIAGQTTPQVLLRYRPDVLNLKPKVIFLLAGSNDIAQRTGFEPRSVIEGNLISMAELAVKNNIKLIMVSVLPACGIVAPLRPIEQIIALNAFISQYAEENGHIYVDFFSALVGPDGYLVPELSKDCLHPNSAGYEIMAPLVEAAIEQALSS